MNKKLTLSFDKTIIERAKTYAQSHNISLSKLIESYLSSLTSYKTNGTEITPLVESLSGVISLDKGFDKKNEYTKFLIEKYK